MSNGLKSTSSTAYMTTSSPARMGPDTTVLRVAVGKLDTENCTWPKELLCTRSGSAVIVATVPLLGKASIVAYKKEITGEQKRKVGRGCVRRRGIQHGRHRHGFSLTVELDGRPQPVVLARRICRGTERAC
jgi:hypothetical protein